MPATEIALRSMIHVAIVVSEIDPSIETLLNE